jgi:hypothetical protein
MPGWRDLMMALGTRPALEWAAVFDCYWLRRGAILALTRHSPIKKPKDHDIRPPILGMGRVVAIPSRIPVLVKAASDLRDLERAVLL